jgi:hypothetical protein
MEPAHRVESWYGPAMPSNVRLGWRWLEVKNVQAYNAVKLITAVKKRYTVQESYSQLTNEPNNLECLSLTSLSSLVQCNILAYWAISKLQSK